MSMSDYDLLMFDHEGNPSVDKIRNEFGNEIQTYKNWLYVYSRDMWKSDKINGFSEPCIAQITSGDISIAGFNIRAERQDLQGALFFLIHYDSHFEEKDGVGIFSDKWSCGIVCHGFIDIVKQILALHGRLEKENLEHWYETGEHYNDGQGNSLATQSIENSETREEIVYWRGGPNEDYDHCQDWIGVSPELVEEFWKWLEPKIHDSGNNQMNEWYKKCKESTPLRINQGDLYFQNNAGLEATMTEPGKAEVPVIFEMMK